MLGQLQLNIISQLLFSFNVLLFLSVISPTIVANLGRCRRSVPFSRRQFGLADKSWRWSPLASLSTAHRCRRHRRTSPLSTRPMLTSSTALHYIANCSHRLVSMTVSMSVSSWWRVAFFRRRCRRRRWWIEYRTLVFYRCIIVPAMSQTIAKSKSIKIPSKLLKLLILYYTFDIILEAKDQSIW